jgi:hypothetical protein
MVGEIRNEACEYGLSASVSDEKTEIHIKTRELPENRWDEWFNVDLLLLEKSTDFDVGVERMKKRLKVAARRRAKIVGYSLHDPDGKKLVDSLIIMARDMTAEERVVGISLVRGRFVTKQ